MITTTSQEAQDFIKDLLETEDITTLIKPESRLEPGTEVHGSVYEQCSRFKQATKWSQQAGCMTEKQLIMFTCRFIKSMRQLIKTQNNLDAIGLDAHIRAGQATMLFIKTDGKWFTKQNRSTDILCIGAYLAACCQKSNAWTFLLYTEEGDVHHD